MIKISMDSIDSKKEKLLIFFIFFVHLLTLNFFTTNFEGAYGYGANFFQTENKINLLLVFSNGQYNSIIFSILASGLRIILPFLDGDQSIRVLSASSYLLLGIGIINLNKFYKLNYSNLILIFLIMSNTIIWFYGHRMYVDLFSFSLAIFAFSKILNKNYYYNIHLILIGLSIVLKPFNLIFLPIIFIVTYFNGSKRISIKEYLKIFLLIITIPFFYYSIFYFFTNNIILPRSSEDLNIVFFSSDASRGINYLFNNFISYIGYLNLIFLPFSILVFYKTIKNFKIFINAFIILILFLISYYLSSYTYIAAELDFGPLNNYIDEKFFLFAINFSFVFFISTLITLFINYNNTVDLRNNFFFTLFFIIIYLFCLSFIKGSQRYIILAIPFYYFVLLHFDFNKKLIIFVILIYFFLNILLLINYYYIGKSSKDVVQFLRSKDILYDTFPGVIVPHVWHLYQNIDNYNSGHSMYLKSSDYIVVNGNHDEAIFTTSNMFKNLSVIKNNN